MRKRNVLGLLSFLLFVSACSGDRAAVVTTTTTAVPITPTTLDEASIREAKKTNLLSELFTNNQVGDYEKPNNFFATTEEIQQILRKYGVFGNVKASFTGYDALLGIQVQRELCDDWLLEDLVASAKPSRTVGRFFSWAQQPGTEDSSAAAILAHGGMNIFEVSDNGLAGLVADYFALRGGVCEPTSYQYGLPNWENWQERFDTEIKEQWWTEQQLLKVGVEVRNKFVVKWDSAYFGPDSEFGTGFRIVQTAENRSFLRVFKIVPNTEMGLLTVIELNIIRNGTSKDSPSINELAKTYGPAFAELEIKMESKLKDYLESGQ